MRRVLEWITGLDTAWIALIGTVFGGAGLKLLESILSRSKDKVDAAAAMRTELRNESKTLKEELRIVERDLDSWKEKYFMLLQEYLEIKARLIDGDSIPVKSEEDW